MWNTQPLLLKAPGNWDQSIRASRPWQYEGRVPDLSWDGILDMILGHDNFWFALSDHRAITTGLHVTAMIFSALHVVAWNWDFPSSTAQVLWRTFSVAAIGVVIAPLVLTFPYSIINIPEMVLNSFVLTMAIIYLISHLGLIVLIFYCFSSVPASVYETVDWTSYFPHFA